jgi:Fe-S cluster assembly ATPase SufC
VIGDRVIGDGVIRDGVIGDGVIGDGVIGDGVIGDRASGWEFGATIKGIEGNKNLIKMWKNYLKIAYRNLWKNKVFGLINILGLAIAMAACLLILKYVGIELSFDDFRRPTVYRIADYSSGMLKKASLLLAFLGNPKLIILDEPFTTIDTASQNFLIQLIELKWSEGVNFLISTHQKAFVDLLPFESVLTISNGRINHHP